MRRAILTACLLLAPIAVHAEEMVSFASPDGTVLQARYFAPAGSGPFPAVVALHGCGGPDNAQGRLTLRHRDWAERWVSQGFAVLLPDSFGSRGLGSICGSRARSVTPRRERTGDADAARRYLQSRRDIRADRINLVGWSNGGSTVLWALAPGARARDGGPDFARAVAFYPGCRTPADRGVIPRVPVLILIGEADDWTPVEPCRDYVARARGLAQIVTYPGAFHGFDDPNSRPRRRTGLAYTRDGTGEAMVGTDPAARADAITRVSGFLAR
jgi:dienelactone hydrolase